MSVARVCKKESLEVSLVMQGSSMRYLRDVSGVWFHDLGLTGCIAHLWLASTDQGPD